MIAKELQYRSRHYISLMVVMSILFAIYVFSTSMLLRTGIALVIGFVYLIWGLWSHAKEIRTTRLVLEYVAVGALGAVILTVLAATV